jgi:hypothetical protein
MKLEIPLYYKVNGDYKKGRDKNGEQEYITLELSEYVVRIQDIENVKELTEEQATNLVKALKPKMVYLIPVDRVVPVGGEAEYLKTFGLAPCSSSHLNRGRRLSG